MDVGADAEYAMRQPGINDTVRLMQDVPNLMLRRGDVGVVCSIWFAPMIAFEVEFRTCDDQQTRALLFGQQIRTNEPEPAESPFEALDPDQV